MSIQPIRGLREPETEREFGKNCEINVNRFSCQRHLVRNGKLVILLSFAGIVPGDPGRNPMPLEDYK